MLRHASKIKMEQEMRFNNKCVIRLNVGGTIFQCYAGTLKTFPDSVLAHLDESTDCYMAENAEYFFDRNPLIFAYILDASRRGSIHLPKDICGTTFREELEFWKISPRYVASCCWEALYKSDEDKSTMQKLIKNLKQNRNTCLSFKTDVRLSEKIWLFLDEPSSSKYALVWGAFISVLIVLSTFSVALSTLPQLSVDYTESEKEIVQHIAQVLGRDNETKGALEMMKPHPYLMNTDFVIHIIVTMEFLLSFVVCPNKKTFAAYFMRIAVSFGYVSFWISYTMEMNLSTLDSVHKIRAYLVFKHIVILKLARLLYLTKRIPAFNIMGLTFRSSRHELNILIFMLGLLICIFGSVMFFVEYFQNPRFTNMFTTMYWALITLTTVGYGHYIPDTAFGHVVAAACAVCGIVCLALPIGIIASSFHTFYNYNKYAQNHVNLYGKETVCPCGDQKQ